MSKFFENHSAKVMVIEPGASVRQLTENVVRDLGFSNVTGLATCKEALSLLETESFDWLITGLQKESDTNALQLIQVFTTKPKFSHMRVSLFLQDNETDCLPLAFELGLLSWHPRAYTKDSIEQSFKDLMVRLKRNHWTDPLTAAEYLHEHLQSKRHHQSLLSLYERLNDLYCGSPSLLINLAEAQALCGQKEQAFQNFKRACFADPTLTNRVNSLYQQYFSRQEIKNFEENLHQNLLGVKECLIIDPDTAVLATIKDKLEDLGMEGVLTFDDGNKAFEHCKNNKDADLIILEWRVPSLPGPLLIQKLRQLGMYKATFVVISSLIKAEDTPLLKEMGIAAIINKPFSLEDFAKTIMWTLQENSRPTEQRSLERRMRQLLEQNNFTEADRLRTIYNQDPRIGAHSKKQIEAEFYLSKGDVKSALDLSIDSLKIARQSLDLLNLVGKCFLKLGNHNAALKFFEKAQSISPMNIERLCDIANIQIELDQTDEASKTLHQLSSIDPDNSRAKELKTALAIHNKDPNQTREMMAKLESTASMVSYLNNRAIALSRSGRFQEAIDIYKEVLEHMICSDSDTVIYLNYNYALTHTKFGNLTEAMQLLQKLESCSDKKLQNKAKSLITRIRNALLPGGTLILYINNSSDQNQGQDLENDHILLLEEAGEIVQGDLCCYLLFKPVEPTEQWCQDLIVRTAVYKERNALDFSVHHHDKKRSA